VSREKAEKVCAELNKDEGVSAGFEESYLNEEELEEMDETTL
jgi:hypothetical protein